MLVDWFSGSVSGAPQTVPYILTRMALTMCQPDHPHALRHCCHQKAAMEIAHLHNSDKLTEAHAILMFGLGKTIYHTIVVEGDEVVYDWLADETCHFDPVNKRYRSSQGNMELKHSISVDEFFSDYVEEVILPSSPAEKLEPAL